MFIIAWFSITLLFIYIIDDGKPMPSPNQPHVTARQSATKEGDESGTSHRDLGA